MDGFVFFFGLRRFLPRFLRALFVGFGSGVLGAGRISMHAGGAAASFHCTVTFRALSCSTLLVQVNFQRVLFSAILINCSKELVGGASASMLVKSLLSYCTLTACLTRRSSPILRMWPSHSCFLFLMAWITSKVRLRGLASA